MKLKKLLISVIASASVVTSMMGSLSTSAADQSRWLYSIDQQGQKYDYFCGYAAMLTEIDHSYRLGKLKGSNNKKWDQDKVAVYMQDHYNHKPYQNGQYDQYGNKIDGSLAWYVGSSNSVDYNQNMYPAGRALKAITGFSYIAYGCCTSGESSLRASEVKSRVRNTINNNHAVLACGRSNPEGSSYLPNYPTWTKIEHWIAVDGYNYSDKYGDNIWILDPAARGCGGAGFENVPQSYSVTLQKFTDFAWFHGILW